jgi:hypothetical protein
MEYRYHDRDLSVSGRPQEWVYRIVPYNARDDIEGLKSDIEIKVRISGRGVQVL